MKRHHLYGDGNTSKPLCIGAPLQAEGFLWLRDHQQIWRALYTAPIPPLPTMLLLVLAVEHGVHDDDGSSSTPRRQPAEAHAIVVFDLQIVQCFHSGLTKHQSG